MTQTPNGHDGEGPYGTTRKARDRALVLTVAGIVFLMPPVAAIFLVHGTLFGIPLPLVYIFAVWLLLVAGALLLKPGLQAAHDLDDAGRRGPDDG